MISTKEQAIEMCQMLYSNFWPNNTNWYAPPGWKWVIHMEPYAETEYYLILDSEYYDPKNPDHKITRGDIE